MPNAAVDLSAVDPSLLVPHLDAGDALRFVLFVLCVVVLPGHALRQLAGLRIGSRIERWAWVLCLGIVWSSGVFYLLQKFGRPGWHVPLTMLPVAIDLLLYGRSRKLVRSLRQLKCGWNLGQVVGLTLIALFVIAHVASIASLIKYDADGLRLYGELHGDKFNLMSQCAAVEHDLPPRNLRYADHRFPYHFFPHLFVASCKLSTGVDYIHGFLFYATALGIAAQGMAILGFCRRVFRSNATGVPLLVVYGLLRFGPDAKPLDLTFALLLLGLGAISRLFAGRRWRWAVCAALLLGAMPCYEELHALTTYAGLGLWWLVGCWPIVKAKIVRHAGVSNDVWRQIVLRTVVVGSTCVCSLLSAQLLASGERVVSPAKFVWSNTYRKEFTHEWREWLKAAPEDHPIACTIYQWKRGEPAVARGAMAEQVGGTRPSVWQRITAEIVFSVIFVGYFVLHYLGVGIFGCQALFRTFQSRESSRVPQSVMACIAMAGFAIPGLVNWGQFADGQWWWSPNLSRINGFALLVLLAAGAVTMVEVLRLFTRPKNWLPLGIAGWALCAAMLEWTNASSAYYLVGCDRLAALAYLRQAVPYGQVVLHPWEHYEIRDAKQDGKIVATHKRQFSLGSALAGQQMFIEGPEHHQFGSTFLTAEEVFRRSRSQRAFFATSPYDTSEQLAAVAEVFEQADVRWIVADREHPAPEVIDRDWTVMYANATVCVYTRTVQKRPINLAEKNRETASEREGGVEIKAVR